jgi:hypothetical protein
MMSSQIVLRFDGSDYDHKRDGIRLTGQLERVFDVMKSGEWITLRQLADRAKCPEASASAQMRNLRKERFGSFAVEKKYDHFGVFLYRLKLEAK